MKKLSILLVTGIMSCWVLSVSAQSRKIITENFDGNSNTFTASPASAWKIDTNYYNSSPNSIWGIVPNMMGDSVTLMSPVYDFTNYSHVLLRFSHICKVSPNDIARVEYRTDVGGGMDTWSALPVASYLGKVNANQYALRGFNANSYSQWEASDSLALPNLSWWKEELFDLRVEAGYTQIQFRFIITHGNTSGTQISYGWLIDDIEIIAASYEVTLPIVEFLAPFVQDTVYSTGAWEINAKVKSRTLALIETPWLKYIATHNGTLIANDSILMDMVAGDSLWKAIIPHFIVGTEVIYSITGRDTLGNIATTISNYTITKSDHNYGNNSVALTSIDSPIRGQTIGGVNMPVMIRIRNKGDSVLTSATIHWSVNGVVRQPYSWTGNLPWDFEQQVALDTYQLRMEDYDTIQIWVDKPNNIQDIVLTDDTLTIITYGCVINVSGIYTVGEGGNFSTIKEALIFLSLCPPVGNITFRLLTGTYHENLDLTNTNNLIGNNTLTITSAASNADSVILRPASGVGIRLANSNNLVIKDITVDAATSGTYAVQFISACTNVTIRDCKLLANSTTTSPSYAPIYKAPGSGIVDRIFIVNNLLNGGYYGFYFYGGIGIGQYGTNVIFDSNTVSNKYRDGIYSYFTDFTSCSYNTILSRMANIGSIWQGIYMGNCNGSIIGNRIIQRSTAIISSQAMSFYQHNCYNTTDTGLIANNEIIISAINSNIGINMTGSYLKILHNSIYVSGTGRSQGIYNGSFNGFYEIKNNNIIMKSISAYPIYLSAFNSQQHDIENNNMYAPNYVGYAGGNKTTMTVWQQTVTTDKHSISILPNFVDPTINLELINYKAIYTLPIQDVAVDITGTLRTGITALGCYHGLPSYIVNASLIDLLGYQEGFINGSQDTIKVILFNEGSTPLTTANISWSFNGSVQSSVNWSGNLAFRESDTLILDILTYSSSGDYTLSAWINNLGALQDAFLDDDTVSISGYVCTVPLSGIYTIGINSAFPNLSKALNALTICGANGDIVFEIQSDIYNENINLTDISSALGNNKLTITSATHKAADVVFVTNSVGITLNNSNNIILKDITIDATAGIYAVQFAGACTNVVIRDCRLLSDTTTGTLIYKDYRTGIVDSIFIINNLLDGGYYGCYFYGGETGQYGTNIVFDSNTISNSYYSGTNFTYVDFISYSYNTILSRTTNTNLFWVGLEMASNNGPVIGNRIIQRSTAIMYPDGMYLYNHNYDNTTDTGLISNNEIIINTAESTAGISTYYSHLKILYNSIYVAGMGTSRGIYVGNSIDNFYEIRNNNIVMESSLAYPIYLESIIYLNQYDIDYNNIYAPTYVGYAGGNKETIVDWRKTIITDKHSVSVSPSFIDNTQSLRLTDYTGLDCPVHPLVRKDLDNNFRNNLTTMGAYHRLSPPSVNASLTDVLNWREGVVLGQNDTVGVILYNRGSTTLTTTNIEWTFNGISQPPITWSGSLAYGQWTTVYLKPVIYTIANNMLQAWIDNLGGLTDVYPQDDTIKVEGYVCAAPLSGVYSVGATGAFSNLSTAQSVLAICGTDGDITLEMQLGTYNESINLTNISSLLGNNSLTITSATHNASDVVFVTNDVGITLNNSNNIILKDITIDATAGWYAIQFTDACTNVVIRDCNLLTDTITFFKITSPIYKDYGTGIVDSIFIINNLLNGGHYGCYFIGGIEISQYGTHIVFDSNIVCNQYENGSFIQYTDFTSYSYNTILSHTTNSSPYWYALNITYCNGPIVGNRIIQRNTAITPIGIYLMEHNQYNTTDMSLIANNEIMLNTMDNWISISGINAFNSKVKILHNSIYISGTGMAHGIDVYTNYLNEIKNNNIVIEGSLSYPIYLETTQYCDIDYNNMYAPTYVGYAGGDKITMADWQQTVTTDQHSVSIYPSFIDNSVNLELSDYSGLLCPFYPEVPRDIEGYFRASTTNIGAYTIEHSFDLGIEKIICTTTEVVYPQTAALKIKTRNTGNSVNINNATFGWSINGEVQPSYTWNTANPLAPTESIEISIGSFSAGKTSTFDIVVWIESVNGCKDSIIWNDTLIASVKILCTGNNISLSYIEQLVEDGVLCTEDYTSLKVKMANTGTLDYDFAVNPVTFSLRVTNPESYSLDTIISSGEIKSGESAIIELSDMFPIITAGQYNIKVWIDSIDYITYDDTTVLYYISGRFGLPIDEDFSSSTPIAFNLSNNNAPYLWQVITQGIGIDTVVSPQFGTGMLAFAGTPGSMTTLSTQQMDLSRTQQPSLSFWYFHDTVPCEDYTDVRVTIDGGTTYTTLFSLTKYNALYGWKQYSMDLPPYEAV
jgi:hypothetical protein